MRSVARKARGNTKMMRPPNETPRQVSHPVGNSSIRISMRRHARFTSERLRKLMPQQVKLSLRGNAVR